MKKLMHPPVLLRAGVFLLLGGVLLAARPQPVSPGTTKPVYALRPAGDVLPADSTLPRRSAAETALEALAPHVKRTSNPAALRTALEAYYAYREANPEAVKKPYLYFVDLGLDNASRRGWVFDMDALELIEGPFTVAHGRGSSKSRNGVPTSFSNRPGSYASSLGLYLAQETYTFTGKSSGRRYSSVGLRMRGESGSFNDAARRRGIVAHGAPYVSAREAGRSEGCPAMEMARARRLLPLIANGGVVFLYSPRDARWRARDPWVNGRERERLRGTSTGW